MSVYKVPQDVEADDKLLGPFNFRQFIYLMVSAGLIFISLFLFQIFPGLIIIPAPFLIFFLTLSLPLKKDQPMEAYLAAVVSFHLKPKKRLWEADGIEHMIEISAPIKAEEHLIKNIARDEASRRFSYLADIVDTQGWAIKNAVSQDSNVHTDIIAESHNAGDMFEDRASRIDSMLKNTNDSRKKQIIQNMNTARNLADYTDSNTQQIQAQTFNQPNATDLYNDSIERARRQQQNDYLSWNQNITNNTQGYSNFQNQQPQQNFNSGNNLEDIKLSYNPYPNSMKQSVISPNRIAQSQYTNFSPQPQQQIQSEQIKPEQINPEIIKLVSEGKDLSIETMARQAERINHKKEEIDLNNNEEVIISLR